MKKKKVHKSQYGSFDMGFQWDHAGYIQMHSSNRYRQATDLELDILTRSRSILVRNAAYGESIRGQ
jgi:hypothetical protein